MSEVRDILIDSANRLMADSGGHELCARVERGEWPEEVWARLVEMGLPQALASAGDDLTVEDTLAVVNVCGYHALPLPLAESLLGNRLLRVAGLPCGDTPVSLVAPASGLPRLTRNGDQWCLNGELHRVAYGRHVDRVLLLADTDHVPALISLPTANLEWHQDIGLCGEPRDSVGLINHQVSPSDFAPYPENEPSLLFWGALLRALQMTGAMRRVLELSVQYANEREQFGRPIGKFQAVQQQLSVAAGQVAAASAAAEFAARRIISPHALYAVATAKARVGEAAGVVAAVGHQVHAAMGFTQEHTLHLEMISRLKTRSPWSMSVVITPCHSRWPSRCLETGC